MKQHEKIKRKHHYVWGYYIKQWSLNNRDVYYTTTKNKVALDSIKGIACETDFYKINFLNEADANFLQTFIAMTPNPEVRSIHSNYLEHFKMMSHVEHVVKSHKIPEYMNKELAAFENNVLENLHSAHENEAVKIIQRLNSGDLSVLDSSLNRVNLFAFIAMQMTRSKAFRDMMISANELAYKNSENSTFSLAEYDRLMKKNWWFISYMLGTNIGASFAITREKNKHVLLENNTSEPFITSDNPVINVHESLGKLKQYEAPEFADFYYPLSPKYAFMINDSNRFTSGKVNVTEDTVREFNDRIALKAHKHMFSQTEAQLTEIKNRKK